MTRSCLCCTQERDTVFHNFSASRSGILLTTDVASRGLDLPAVAWVVQYHMTGGPVDYVHRVGRTARAGGRGKALLFLSPDESCYSQFLSARTGAVIGELNLSDLLQTALFHLSGSRQPARTKVWICFFTFYNPLLLSNFSLGWFNNTQWSISFCWCSSDKVSHWKQNK